MRCLDSRRQASKVYIHTHDLMVSFLLLDLGGFFFREHRGRSHLADKTNDKKLFCRILNFALAIGGITVL